MLLLSPLKASGKSNYALRFFLHLDTKEIRQEIFLSTSLLNLISPEKQNYEELWKKNPQEADEKIFLFLKEKGSLKVNGISLQPVFRELNRWDQELQVVLSYPSKVHVDALVLEWNLYPKEFISEELLSELVSEDGAPPSIVSFLVETQRPQMEKILLLDRVAVLLKENQREPISLTLTPEKPQLSWQSEGKAAFIRPFKVDRPPAIFFSVSLFSFLVLVFLLFFLIKIRGNRQKGRRKEFVFSLFVLLLAWGGQNVGLLKLPLPREKLEISKTRAKKVFVSLHQNIYRAFDYSDKSDLYDALAESVAGDLLIDVYKEVYQNLLVRDDLGRRCEIKSVEMLECKILPPLNQKRQNRKKEENTQYRAKCRWKVEGYVLHTGHTHLRINEYSAIYTVSEVEENWKITSSKILSQRRIEEKTDDSGK